MLAGSTSSKVFFLSDVTLSAGGVETRMFGIDAGTNKLLDTSGVTIPGIGLALDVENDASGDSQAYIARFGLLGQDTGVLAAVNVELVPASWTVADEIVTFPGVAASILAHRFDNGTVRTYVTSVSCTEDGIFTGDSSAMLPGGMMAMGPGGPGPCPISTCDGGGGGGGSGFTGRRLWLTAVDVTNPAIPARQVLLLSEHEGITCNSFGQFDNIGMALTADGSKLFIANPAEDRVEVFDTNTNTLGTAIPVGIQPVDIAIVRAGGSGGPERAYVLSQLDRAIYIVDVSDPPQIIGTPILLEDPADPDPTRRPVAISVRSDGLRAFTADGMHGTLTVVDITPLFEKWLRTISVGGTATRLELLMVP